jgi:hypothetical protein
MKILVSIILLSLLLFGCGEPGEPLDKNGVPISFYQKGIAMADGMQVLDTYNILNNLNLDTLLARLDRTSLIESKDKKNIPSKAQKFLNTLLKKGFRLANPDEPWQSTDVVMDTNLPWRKLTYLGLNDKYLLMTYHRGGIFETNEAIIIEFGTEGVTDFWSGSLSDDFNCKKDIIRRLRRDEKKEWGLNTNMFNY